MFEPQPFLVCYNNVCNSVAPDKAFFLHSESTDIFFISA